MFGYNSQDAAAYGAQQYQATYSSNPVAYTQQTQQQQDGGSSVAALQNLGAAASAYANSYNFTNAASAYAQYGQAATVAQQASYNQNASAVATQYPYAYPSYADYANAFKSVSGTAISYGGKGPSTGTGVVATAGYAGGVAGHYAGFESAVTAAASNLMQKKGTGKNWNAGAAKKAGGPNYGNKKRFGFGLKPRGDTTQHFCEICKISCAGAQTFKEHQEGKSHKKKEAAANKGTAQKVSIYGRANYNCTICDVACSSKDTYDAHVKGAKHTKTYNLLLKLNKPIPSSEPVVAQPEPKGAPIPTLGGGPMKKVVGVTGTKFVGGSKLVTTTMGGMEIGGTGGNVAIGDSAALKGANGKNGQPVDPDIKPIGEEFIEEERHPNSGKFLNYLCKLCDCKFSDVNAKDIHLKGRRHRLQYKAKIDPSLKVDMKPSGWGKRSTAAVPPPTAPPTPLNRSRPYPQPQANYPPPPSQQLRPLFPVTRSSETMDDRHVIYKLSQLEFSQEEMGAIDKLVSLIEKTLKSVSDSMTNELSTSINNEPPQDNAVAKANAQVAAQMGDRVLKGVMRVGLLAKNILLKSDKEVELVMLCSKVPNESLLHKVVEMVKKLAEVGSNEGVLIVEPKIEDSAFVASLSGIPVSCKVILTCVGLRESPTTAGDGGTAAPASIEKPPDALPFTPCLNALAELRHAKFYQVKCSPLHSMNSTVKIFRDIANRIHTWGRLSCWALELLIEKGLSSLAMPLSPGDAIRRLFEVVASGVLLGNRTSLMDPCEKTSNDVLSCFSDQEREDLTSSAQHALRLISFNQIYKILAIPRLPDKRGPSIDSTQHIGPGLKRTASAAEIGDGCTSDSKKEKKDDQFPVA